MKFSALLVAIGIAAGTLTATAAEADRYHGHGYDRRGHHRDYRDGRHRDRNCRTFYHHGRRVTRCR